MIYAFALVGQLAGSIISLPLLVNLMTPDAYGAAIVSASIVGLLAPVVGLGLPSAVMRVFFGGDDKPTTTRSADSPEAKGPTIAARTLASATVAATLIVSIAAIGVYALWLVFDQSFEIAPAPLIAIATIATVTHTGCATLLRAEHRATAYVTTVLLAGVGGQIGAVVSVVGFEPTVEAYLVGFAAGNTLAAVYGAARTYAYAHGLLPLHDLKEILPYSLPFVTHGVAWFALAMGDRLVIGAIDGPGSVAVYHVAYTIGSLGVLAITALGNAWMPLVYGAEDRLREEIQAEAGRTLQVLGIAIAILLSMLGPPLISTFAPKSYSTSSVPVVISLTAATTLFWIAWSKANQTLLWHKATTPLAWITPLAVIINLGLVVVLLPIVGISGAAVATLIAYAFLAHAASLRAAPFRTQRFSRKVETLTAGVGSLALLVGAVLPYNDGVSLVIRYTIALGTAVLTLLWLRHTIRAEGKPARI